MKMIIFMGAVFLIFLIGCKEIPDSKGTQLADPYICEQDSDCAVKDVHNCCGYYPRCININHEPDIKAVQEACQKKGLVSVCGFPEIDSCKCVENKCESMQDGEIV